MVKGGAARSQKSTLLGLFTTCSARRPKPDAVQNVQAFQWLRLRLTNDRFKRSAQNPGSPILDIQFLHHISWLHQPLLKPSGLRSPIRVATYRWSNHSAYLAKTIFLGLNRSAWESSLSRRAKRAWGI